MDLSVPLGSSSNYEEVRHLIDLISSIEWSQVPAEQSSRGTLRVDLAPGRTAPNSGDYVFYDPWEERFMTSSDEVTAFR